MFVISIRYNCTSTIGLRGVRRVHVRVCVRVRVRSVRGGAAGVRPGGGRGPGVVEAGAAAVAPGLRQAVRAASARGPGAARGRTHAQLHHRGTSP